MLGSARKSVVHFLNHKTRQLVAVVWQALQSVDLLNPSLVNREYFLKLAHARFLFPQLLLEPIALALKTFVLCAKMSNLTHHPVVYSRDGISDYGVHDGRFSL
jgi:hypothetical protein